MAGDEHILRPILDAGSSRVFNCNDRLKRLLEEKVADPYFFRIEAMHSLVLVKEAIPDPRPSETRKIIGTKLYFPYNRDNIYEGGRSIFYHSQNLFDVLNEQFGVRGEKASDQDIAHDVKILTVLDQLPSLDGFLMSDALHTEGIVANELYFEVDDEERVAIQNYIARKFQPLVQAAFGTQDALQGKVSQLVEKIWEAKDKVALAPLIKACRFPDNEALAIFGSWKGIIFYTFEYERTRAKREGLALWLRDSAIPNRFATHNDLEHIRHLRRTASQRLRHHWSAVDEIARTYNMLYANFLGRADGVANFMEFLRGAHHIYWQMGDSLSKLSHAVNCWSLAVRSHRDKLLPPDRLQALLEIMNLILVQEHRVVAGEDAA